jgi:hypothetical protein
MVGELKLLVAVAFYDRVQVLHDGRSLYPL